MDGFLCLLNKKCRQSKSKEIVENMAKEQNTLEQIYENMDANDEKKDSNKK